MEPNQKIFNSVYFPTAFAKKNLIVADNMGCIDSKNFFCERGTFDNNVFMYICSGKLHVEQYGIKQILTKGQGIFMRLTDKHKYYTDKVDGCRFLWVHLSGVTLEPILNTLSDYYCLPVVFKTDTLGDEINALFTIIQENPDDFEFLISQQLYKMVTNTVKPQLEYIQNTISKKQSWFSKRVTQYVDEHICEKITLETLGEHFKMSVFYFSKTFTACFSISPIQFVLHKKIICSQEMLKQNKLSVQEIAYNLGFADQSHFTKTFKKQLGISPLAYRKSFEK